MNRTIERWKEVFHDYVEVNGNNVAANMLQKAVDDMQELARQRDELLAVLESIIHLHDSAMRGNQVAETIGKARAVIQKVRGGE